MVTEGQGAAWTLWERGEGAREGNGTSRDEGVTVVVWVFSVGFAHPLSN